MTCIESEDVAIGDAIEQAGPIEKRYTAIVATFRALRPKQWIKNVLLFVPLFVGPRVGKLGQDHRVLPWLCGVFGMRVPPCTCSMILWTSRPILATRSSEIAHSHLVIAAAYRRAAGVGQRGFWRRSIVAGLACCV